MSGAFLGEWVTEGEWYIANVVFDGAVATAMASKKGNCNTEKTTAALRVDGETFILGEYTKTKQSKALALMAAVNYVGCE